MADTPITDMFRRLAHPTTTERASIERDAGRTIISLSRIEDDLAFMFGVLVGQKNYVTAVNVISELNGPAVKIKLVDLMMQKEALPAELKKWKSIYSVLMTHKSVRDLVAHQPLHYVTDEATGLQTVRLAPPYFGSRRRKGQILDSKMIAVTADALEPLEISIYELAKEIMLRVVRGPVGGDGTPK